MSVPILIENGVQQVNIFYLRKLSGVCNLLLLSSYFAKFSSLGICVRCRLSDFLFNQHLFAFSSILFVTSIVSDTLADMQIHMRRISPSRKTFGFSISLGNTVVMFQPVQ